MDLLTDTIADTTADFAHIWAQVLVDNANIYEADGFIPAFIALPF